MVVCRMAKSIRTTRCSPYLWFLHLSAQCYIAKFPATRRQWQNWLGGQQNALRGVCVRVCGCTFHESPLSCRSTFVELCDAEDSYREFFAEVYQP